ncbi:hypothetical protein F8388_003806 [Cannabis sativa]|uniref:Uncharacterized protein n=1 Tax=Cannabis sativa TaxID=3483 RepID=A0A7J6DU44_CANSA|nr:hypothetical protein F8388_003806 [Cannabis sativa]
MSRCFPFPPPGYERKARNNEVDLLEKEKHREKKHKKDKKDKEKREGQKRDKEKDGEKPKDKTKTLDDKRVSGKSESHGGEKFIQKDVRDKDISADKKLSTKIGDNIKAEKLTKNSNGDDESKVVQEFARRTKEEATGIGNKFESFPVADRRKDEGMVRFVAKDTSTLAAGMVVKRGEFKTTDGQGTRDVTRPGGNAMVQNTTGMVQTKFESLPRLLDKSGDTKMDGNEKTKDKESDDKHKQKEGRRNRGRRRRNRREEKKREEKEEKAKEKIQLKTTTELDTLRESNKQNLNNHTIKTAQLPNDSNNNGVPVTGTPKKRKEIETNGVAHAHDNLPDRKGGSNNLKMESKDKSDRKGASNNLKMDNKDRKINGVIETHPLSVSTMKLKSAKAVADPIAEASSVRPPDTEARPSSVSHNMKLKSATAVADPIAEALVKPLHPEAQQPSSASPKKPKSATVAADPISETLARPPHTEAKPLSVSPMKPKSAPPPPPPPPAVDPIAEALARPPHPDSKYISQIYSVPNREEWSDHSDDEWLFDIKASETTKKAKLEPSTVEETPQVWSEAQQIESADILALPYVIPY